jgi:hypothetical protein
MYIQHLLSSGLDLLSCRLVDFTRNLSLGSLAVQEEHLIFPLSWLGYKNMLFSA